mmetsp:Transcript_13318/g.35535  ORF Transcript_13318/g.35535 Transcript_13318/m.35535 type:complete len:576 (+) Transcript_13318:113-1840(+)
MALRHNTSVRLRFGKMPPQICANLPWPMEVTAHEAKKPHYAADSTGEEQSYNGKPGEEEPLADDAEPMDSLNTTVVVKALRCITALEENFANCELGKWKVTCETHYEYGFDEDISATGHPSMFLKGGNDSNFGMVMTVLPSKGDGFEEDHDSDPERNDLEKFQPARVTFYVRTDSPNSDAGHFILGESNEVNRRVAQFQFTREGNMGLLGSGGTSFGAVPYEAHTWYRIDLTFNWHSKTVDFYVNCKLEQCDIPFRRPSSSYIGACALGNRDRCTTWFDSFSFIHEGEVSTNRLPMVGGKVSGWCAPVLCDEELWLHAVVEHQGEDRRGSGAAAAETAPKANGAFVRWGPFVPVPAREVAQRHALNEEALNEMRSMLDDEATADVEFRVGSDRIFAHACILAARCETFKRMLESPMAEGRPASAAGERAVRSISVGEVRTPVFRKMLEFLYAGAIDVDADMAIELLALADQYMLRGLKLTCGFALRRSITVESVSRIMQAADRYDCDGSELKNQCLNFIMQNYQQVVASPTWEELAHSPQLLLQITRALASAGKEANTVSPPAHNTRKRARDTRA